jgi:hypothetical protein
MTRSDEQLEQLSQLIADLAASLVADHGFITPIDCVAVDANGSELAGHCHWTDDHEGIKFVPEKSDIQSEGLQSPINIRVQDGGSQRAVNAQIRWIPNVTNN